MTFEEIEIDSRVESKHAVCITLRMLVNSLTDSWGCNYIVHTDHLLLNAGIS